MPRKYNAPPNGGVAYMERTDNRPDWMLRGHLQRRGRAGEADVVKKANCPDCGAKLALLRKKNAPLFDVECTGCSFMAQIKAPRGRPRNRITGAGYGVLKEWLEEGNPVPPLIVNFRWETGQQILFYRDIPESHIKVRKLSKNHRYAGYEMFTYVRLNTLKCETLYLEG